MNGATGRSNAAPPWPEGVETFLGLVEHYARSQHDGHLTLMRFGSGWVACFGTVDVSIDQDYGHIWGARTAPSPEEACLNLLYRERLLTWAEAHLR